MSADLLNISARQSVVTAKAKELKQLVASCDKLSSFLKQNGEAYKVSRELYFSIDGLESNIAQFCESMLEEQKKSQTSIDTFLNLQWEEQLKLNTEIAEYRSSSEAEIAMLREENVQLNNQLNELSAIKSQASSLKGMVESLESKLQSLESEKSLESKKHQEEKEAAVKAQKLKGQQISSTLQGKIADLRDEVAGLQKELRESNKELQSINGVTVKNGTFKGKSPQVNFQIHSYSSPITIRSTSDNGIEPLENVPWCFQVMRNNGISINVGPTQWLTAILPSCTDFESEWNPAIQERLHELIMDRAKETHPEQYRLTILAKKEPITNNPILSAEQSEILKKSKLITLFDNASLTITAFVEKVKKRNKKLDDETIIMLHRSIRQISRDFIERNKKTGANSDSGAAESQAA